MGLLDAIKAIREIGAQPVAVASDPTKPEQVHVFEPADLDAIEAALASKRPLLVRGEPGVGKSQLSQAAAVVTKRVYLQQVVDARTEPRDLLWREDAVARLADAQLIAALGQGVADDATKADAQKLRDRIRDPKAYVEPGVLWWAFNWDDAANQASNLDRKPPEQAKGANPANGAIVLIDEIDKADAEVPNGLLEALGSNRFTPRSWREPVTAKGVPPLVVITTNNERVLPDAFVRRCVVHELTLPDAAATEEEAADLIERLVARGQAHYKSTDAAVLREAAVLLNKDRFDAEKGRLHPKPGQAEFLDLVRSVVTPLENAAGNAAGDVERQKQRLRDLSPYFLKKHLGANR